MSARMLLDGRSGQPHRRTLLGFNDLEDVLLTAGQIGTQCMGVQGITTPTLSSF